MKIRDIRCAGLRGATPEGGWSAELKPEDCVHTLVAVHTDSGVIGLGSVFTNDALVRAAALPGEDMPDAAALGLALFADWFARRGLPIAFPDVPHQGRTLRTADVTGMPIEFYFKMDRCERMLQKYAAHRGARIQRIDHINCFTPDVQASYDFYTDLGFRLTEYTETDDRDGKLWAVWLHRKGNVHDLAFTNGSGPRLHHIRGALQVET